MQILGFHIELWTVSYQEWHRLRGPWRGIGVLIMLAVDVPLIGTKGPEGGGEARYCKKLVQPSLGCHIQNLS